MTILQNKQVKRGDVYWVKLDPVIGSEIKKTRPAIVISNDIQNKVSGRIIVLSVTSNTNQVHPFEAKVIVHAKEARVLTDQIRTIDKTRIGEYIGKITKSELKEIERAIKMTLSLE